MIPHVGLDISLQNDTTTPVARAAQGTTGALFTPALTPDQQIPEFHQWKGKHILKRVYSESYLKKLHNYIIKKPTLSANPTQGFTTVQKKAPILAHIPPHLSRTLLQSSSQSSDNKRIFIKLRNYSVINKPIHNGITKKRPLAVHTPQDSTTVKATGVESFCEQIRLFLFPCYPESVAEGDALLENIEKQWNKATPEQRIIFAKKFSCLVGKLNAIHQEHDPASSLLASLRSLTSELSYPEESY